MKIDFRQGIVSYQEQNFLQATGGGSAVNLVTSSGNVVVAFAQRTADYLHVENNDVPAAWSGISVGTTTWLYWDINPKTAIRTFGFTTVQPTSGPTQPAILTTDLHWFDTVNNVMKVYDGTRFLERIRVFAARINGTSLFPMGSNTARPFAGTQVGINRTTFAGQILFAEGLPVVVSLPGTFSPTSTNPFARNFIFATTETEFLMGGSQKVNSIRLESDVTTALATQNLAAFDVVKYSGFGRIQPAGYNDTSTTTIGIVTDSAGINTIATVILQGVITNPSWNWATVGAELFILENGELTENDPNLTTPSVYSVSKPPVARVLSATEIIFMQGLGKVGPRGLSPASINTIGDVVITNAQAGEILQFEGSPQQWRNSLLELDELVDVNLGSPVVDEDFLQYNSSSNEWVNRTRRNASVGYFGVEPVVRNTSQSFVTSDAGKGIIRTNNSGSVTWTLTNGPFELGDVITLNRMHDADSVTVVIGPNVRVVSAVDGSVSFGSPPLTLGQPSQATLWLVELAGGSPQGVGSPHGSPVTFSYDTWMVNGTNITL
jgi:hypothetical protein